MIDDRRLVTRTATRAEPEGPAVDRRGEEHVALGGREEHLRLTGSQRTQHVSTLVLSECDSDTALSKKEMMTTMMTNMRTLDTDAQPPWEHSAKSHLVCERERGYVLRGNDVDLLEDPQQLLVRFQRTQLQRYHTVRHRERY
jgi:hypothetical protein